MLASIHRNFREGARVGTHDAAIHQFGGQTGKNKAVTLPARPYNVVQEEDLEEIQAAAQGFLKTGGCGRCKLIGVR